MSGDWIHRPAPAPDRQARQRARQHQRQLTKPLGSLGRLEELAITLAGFGADGRPGVDPVTISVFAADHGVSRAGVSAYPTEVTVQMLHNFATGGAAINVLARLLDAHLEVIDLGTATDPGPIAGVLRQRIGDGTANLRDRDAMAPEQLRAALDAGRAAADRALARGAGLFIGGEMGIGNSTAAAALTAALLDLDATRVSGPGTGLDPAGVARKGALIDAALRRYRAGPRATPSDALRALGGFEIAALAGAYVRCAQHRVPVLVDGFIAGSAALAAVAINPSAGAWLLYSHRSAEPGHAPILDTLGATPLLDLRMRLGEGSGAAAAVPLLRIAAALHNRMATFAEAGVNDGH